MDLASRRPIRVLAADDSAVMRRVLKTIFELHGDDPGSRLPPMQLCEVVADGMECLSAIARQRPDVLLLDLEMPRMNGLEVLRSLRTQAPALPVIMCSAYTEAGARATLEALACGAKDYVMKPGQQSDFASALDLLMGQLLPKIGVLASRSVRLSSLPRFGPASVREPEAAPAASSVQVVVIGVSTGGPSALEQMLPGLAKDFPVPILIVQHMPRLFTGALAERLNRRCSLQVLEGTDGATLTPGTIFLAPGDSHMEIAFSGSEATRTRTAVLRLTGDAPLNHCRPSVDPLFQSAAKLYGAGTLAVMMTGMGSDGLAGARAVHQAGGAVLAQDEATSAVWGMPGQVFRAGIAAATLPLSALATELSRRVSARREVRYGVL